MKRSKEKAKAPGKIPANEKAWKIHGKLKALAERGVGGEKSAAAEKLRRIEAKYDFTPGKIETSHDGKNLFKGNFRPSPTAHCCATFNADEMPISSYVKWAIENGAGISCVWKTNKKAQTTLWAEANQKSIPALAKIADTIRTAFPALWQQFAPVSRSPGDHKHFTLGLYDGMMGDKRQAGEMLPIIPKPRKKGRAKKSASAPTAPAPPGIALNPYAVGVELGGQIRVCMPLNEVAAELQNKIAGALEAAKSPPARV